MPAFPKLLHTDPQFYPKTLSFSSHVAKRVDGKLAETIAFLPRRRFSIIPVPDDLAPIYTGARPACLPRRDPRPWIGAATYVGARAPDRWIADDGKNPNATAPKENSRGLFGDERTHLPRRAIRWEAVDRVPEPRPSARPRQVAIALIRT